MKPRIYIDTSIAGGYFDEEFKATTHLLFERLKQGEIRFILSDLLELELLRAPAHVRDLLLQFPAEYFERVEITEEGIKLAEEYVAAKVVGRTSIEDCRHIALASIQKADVLVSWNFKHIVNLDRIHGYNSVNLKFGYHEIEIRSPKELVNYGD